MLSLLQSIFGREEQVQGGYSPQLIEQAVQRAIDATDRRLHALSDGRKRLAPAVVKAVDHVVKLVDGLGEPVVFSAANHACHPLLNVMFASPQRMFEVLGKDNAVAEALPQLPGADAAYGLLIAQMSKRTTLASDMVDGAIRQDVIQTVVSFDEHRLVEVTGNLDQTRRQLKRRAYDVVLRQILETLEQRQEQQTHLKSQHKLLQRKLGLLQQAGWNFEAGSGNPVPDLQALEQQLQQVENELAGLGAATETLNIHLELLQQALGDAGTLLAVEQQTLYLDRRNIEREPGHADAQAIPLQWLRNRKGDTVVVLLVQFDPQAVPRVDYLDAASRALG